MSEFMLDGAINLHEFGVFMPPGRDQNRGTTAEELVFGKQMREALFVLREENLEPFKAALTREAVVGVEEIDPGEPLALCGFVLMKLRLRVHRENFSIACLTVTEAGSTVFAVLGHASRRAMSWPVVESKPRLVIPGGN